MRMDRGIFSPRNSNSMESMSREYSVTILFSSTMSGTISGDMDFFWTSRDRNRTGESFCSSSGRKGLSSKALA